MKQGVRLGQDGLPGQTYHGCSPSIEHKSDKDDGTQCLQAKSLDGDRLYLGIGNISASNWWSFASTNADRVNVILLAVCSLEKMRCWVKGEEVCRVVKGELPYMRLVREAVHEFLVPLIFEHALTAEVVHSMQRMLLPNIHKLRTVFREEG